MNLSAHFSLAEFQASATADQSFIDNRVPDLLLNNARDTAAMLERIREALSAHVGRPVPMVLSSGYRCLALNRLLKSKDSSDHVRAHAADFTAPGFGTPYEICVFLAPKISALGIGQLIYERLGRSWCHVGVPTPDKPENRIITIDPNGTHVGIRVAS